MKKVFYYIRDPEGKIIEEVEGIEMKFADLPGKYALRSVNGCKSKWQVDETETGTVAGEGSTMMGALKDFHFHVDQAGSDGVQTMLDTRKQKMGLK